MNRVHPSAVLGDGVVLGDGNVVGPHAVLLGPLEIGDGNWIGPGVVLGTPPEVRGVEHTAGWERPGTGPGLRIGDRNILREQTLVHQGWREATVIGDDCFLMNKVYVAHDTRIGDGSTLSSTVTMGGHVQVGFGATLGMGAVVHQRTVIGPCAMVGMGAVVTRDVLPFALSYGSPATLRGVNRVGMSRQGLDDETVEWLEAAYRTGAAPAPADVPAALAAAFAWWSAATPVS